jgi:hypothetical protein
MINEKHNVLINFKNNLPNKLYCCDDFNVDNKVRNNKDAIFKKYIQANNFNSIDWLIFDIDRNTCLDEIIHDNLAPVPNIFVSNPKNSHAHLFYKLDKPVHKNSFSSQKALRYAAAVEFGLATKLGADLAYGGLLAKNPLHDHWQIQYADNTAYDLHYLSDCVDIKLIDNKAANRVEYGLGRNCSLFDQVRKWAYKAIRQGYPADYSQWLNSVIQRTEGLNIAFKKNDIEQLPYAEVKSIASSIARFTYKNFTPAGFSAWQSNNGKRSGEVRRKGSIEEASPWLDLGISRRTYYSRKKEGLID